MNAPRWAAWLLARLAPEGRADEVVGDLEESHRARCRRRGVLVGSLITAVETMDMAFALLRKRGGGPAFSLLDLKLGFRMLVKHPALTVLGGLAMAFAIFVGAGTFELISKVVSPDLPLPEGERLVSVRLWDAERSGVESRILYHVAIWQDEVATIEDLGVFRGGQRNLVTADGRAEPVSVAEMSASGFRIAGIPPLLGRTLDEADQRPDAPPVAVIGHDVWRGRFEADPDVVGTTVRLDGQVTEVVGVMPEGFGFPVSQGLWTPFGEEGAVREAGQGPSVVAFGRLAEGVSLDDARAELRVITRRTTADSPGTGTHLQPQVLPYAQAILGVGSISNLLLTVVGLTSNLPLLLFLVLICGNVALLMFARAVSRESELVVRSALGASRARIVGQLFAEALVLAALAAVVGLSAVRFGIQWVLGIVESEFLGGSRLPFWFDAGLSPTTLVYTGLLTLLAAAVAGIVPGLKATRGLKDRLQRATGGGGGGFRFGGVWTAVIVAQIAVTVLAPLITIDVRLESREIATADPGFPAEQYVAARLELPDEGEGAGGGEGAEASAAAGGAGGTVAAEAARAGPEGLARVSRELEERLLADPSVAGVTFAQRIPRQYHPWQQIELDGPMAEPRDERGHRIGSAVVATDYLQTMGARIVAGRSFHSGDLEEGARVVIVNESFVRSVLGGRNPVGQRVRYLANEAYRDPEQDPGPWHEIVGVVQDLGTHSGYGPMGMYHPGAPEGMQPLHVLVHVTAGTPAFASRLRRTAAGVDPSLRLERVMGLDEVTRSTLEFYRFWNTMLLVVSGLALLLSLGGIYSVMAFTVAQRTREIGIRAALGSPRLGTVRAVFRKPLRQVALGILAGALLLAALRVGLGDVLPDAEEVARFAGYVAVVAIVCLTACVAPVIRALSVEPGEALRVE